jgi:hypothetical protein
LRTSPEPALYPRKMTSDSPDRTPSERGAEASREIAREGVRAARHGGAAVEQDERFGPLALLRTRKADGRGLLLFSHRGEGANGG